MRLLFLAKAHEVGFPQLIFLQQQSILSDALNNAGDVETARLTRRYDCVKVLPNLNTVITSSDN